MNDTMNKYLTFTLEDDFFALDISSVREVQDVTEITRIPESEPHMRGVVNLRGNAVPVMDIKMQFGMEPTERTINTRIIILEFKRGGNEQLVGALADSVKEVIEIEEENIDPPPRMGARVRADYLVGVAKKNGRFILLLDLSKVFGAHDIGELSNDADSPENDAGKDTHHFEDENE